MAASTASTSDIFQTKYDEYAEELLATFPELETQIRSAIALDEKERLLRWQAEVRATYAATNPGTILPGVKISDSVWATLSTATQGAIMEYIRLLSMCCLFELGVDASGASGVSQKWMEDAMNEWKTKLESVDFESLMGKFSSFFKTDTSGADASGSPFPKLPEKFLKGQIAKLAEEIVRDIKPEDLGLTPEVMEECEKSPSRAFDILIQLFTKNPAIIQTTIQRIGKRLQQKVQSGAIRPQEIAHEAEELMKEFASNSEFGDLLGSLKGMFGGFGDDDDFSFPAAGGDGNARLAVVKQRLRRKAEAKKAAGSAVASGGAGAPSQPELSIDELVASINSVETKKPKNKKK